MKDFDFNKLAHNATAKLYKTVIEPTLLHGCIAFGLTTADWQSLIHAQNQIQRTFSKSSIGDPYERWVEIHSSLNHLRERGKLAHVSISLKRAYGRAKCSSEARAVVQYRNSAWQAKDFQGKPRRRACRPGITLPKTLNDLATNS